jgi:rhamnosyltransferase
MPGLFEVCGVVVTRDPDIADIVAMLGRIGSQLGGTIIVDNGSRADRLRAIETAARDHARVQVVALGRNAGVAAGQNMGIRLALERGFGFILLFDHDSLPAPDMALRLLAAFGELSSQGARVAAVGPRYLHRDDGAESYFVQLGLLRFRRVHCAGASRRIRATFLISSGCLFHSQALREVGLMREELFIDHVDTEWCLRAAEAGWEFYGICDAVMEHALGEGAMRVWLGRRRRIARYAPIRHYYLFRNAIYLYTRTNFPLRWKFIDAYRLLGALFVFGLLSDNRRSRIRMMAAGIWDGLRGRLGPFEGANAPHGSSAP